MDTVSFAFQSERYSRWKGKSAPSPQFKILKYSYNFWFNEKSLFELERSKRKNLSLQKMRVRNVQKVVRHLLFQQSECLVSSLVLFVFSIVPVHRLLHYSALKGKFCIQFGIIIPIWSRHAPSRQHQLCKWAFPRLSRIFDKKSEVIFVGFFLPGCVIFLKPFPQFYSFIVKVVFW